MPTVLMPGIGVVKFDDSLTGDDLNSEVAKADSYFKRQALGPLNPSLAAEHPELYDKGQSSMAGVKADSQPETVTPTPAKKYGPGEDAVTEHLNSLVKINPEARTLLSIPVDANYSPQLRAELKTLQFVPPPGVARHDFTSSDIQDIADRVKAEHETLFNKAAEPLRTPLINFRPEWTADELESLKDAPKSIQRMAGIADTVGGAANFLTTAEGAATLPLFAAGGVPGALARVGFGGMMVKDILSAKDELGKELGKPKDEQDHFKIGQLESQIGLNALMVGGIGGRELTPHIKAAVMARGIAGAPLNMPSIEQSAAFESPTAIIREDAVNPVTQPISPEPSREIANPGSEAIPGATAPILTEAKDKALSGAGSTPSESPLTPKTVTASQAEPVEVTASAGPSASGEISQNPNISPVGEQPMPMKLLGITETKLQLLQEGKRDVVMIPPGESIPKTPQGFNSLTLPEGTFVFKPGMASDIYLAIKNKTLGKLLSEAKEQPIPAGTDSGPSKGIAASVRNKWTNATDPAFGSEAGFFSLAPLHAILTKLSPALKKTADEILAVGKETLKAGKVNDYRRSVLNWSGKLQRSFGEALDAKREINSVVPDKVRQEGITNWIQANGDPAVLRARAAASNAKNRPGYEAALTLTPKELAIANDVKAAFNTLHARGSFYDVVNSFVDNYVPQIWNLKKGPTYGGARNLRDQFRHNRARAFDTFFDGEQAGYVPKTKAIGDLLPMYLHEMNSVIANRQMVEQLSKGKASDGRPLVVPRGAGSQVTNPAGKSATLVMPKAITTDTADYKTIPNQPALHDWKWTSTDAAGNPVLLKADLALHPEAYNQLKNVLGKSGLREWYSTRTSAVAQIPKLLVHGLDAANSGTKRTMLGMFATFHQVQEGMHALGHRVNPFSSIPKIDLVNDPGQFNAAKHGLMLLPDRVSANQFMEGFKTSGLISRIPAIGPLADHYSEYLFHQYIPGLKYKTYQSILDRNTKLYAKELASGEYKSEDIATLSAEQTNAAFGHLNYADFGRSPTVQHFLQLGLLAPDFLEARTRFALQSLKGVSGSKVGREQLIALGVLAVTQAALAYTGAKLTDGDWDWKRPFEFRKGNRTYTMRSVSEDLQRLLTDTRSFIHSRLSPITGKAAYQLATGTDWRGQKVTATQTAKELALQPVPISLRGLLGVGNSPLSGWEQLAGSVGVKISRYSPTAEVMQLASDYKKNSADPKVVAEYEQDQKTVHPSSQLKPLRDAIQKASQHEFNSAYDKLIADGKTKSSISDAMRQTRPYTGSYKLESKFKASLSPDQKNIYDEALKEHAMLYDKFKAMLAAKK